MACMSTERRCAICTVDAPSVRTLGTLAQHGWRLRVVALADGATRTEYCCAACCETLTGSAPLKTR